MKANLTNINHFYIFFYCFLLYKIIIKSKKKMEMDPTNIALIIIVSMVCIYAVGTLFYIQKKIGEISSCPGSMKSS